jgi:hypothetical protein
MDRSAMILSRRMKKVIEEVQQNGILIYGVDIFDEN